MKQKFEIVLADILDAIDMIEEYTKDMEYTDFKTSRITVDATVRNLEIIGEAVSQLQEDIKKKYTDAPWQEIKNFRNVVIHKYRTVDMSILWDIIQHKLTPLHQQVEEILDKEKADNPKR